MDTSHDADPPEIDWDDLNGHFYSGTPSAYFRTRLNLLVLAAGRPDELAGMLAEGVRYEGLLAKITPGDKGDGDQRNHTAFLVTESQMLLHHVSEALLRLFLGHADLSPCPWLECASLTSFRVFRDRVEGLRRSYWPPALRRQVGRVFLGSAASPTEPSDEWQDAVRAGERLLRLLARRLNEDAHLYNSVKHGMTVVASGDAYLTIGDSEGRPLIGSSGPSVAFLESERRGDDLVWFEATRWLSLRQTMLLCDLAVRQIDALWAVARARYTDADLSSVDVVTNEALDAVMAKDSAAGAVTRFRRVVAVESRRAT